MRKFARVAGIIFLLFVVCCASVTQSNLAQHGAAFADRMVRNGFRMDVSYNDLEKVRPGEDIYIPKTIRDIGGVIFQGTAIPAGNAVGRQVAIAYNRARTDGQRFRLTIGGKAVTAELYDWE